MATVLDVAEKIVELLPAARHERMKLQKLVFYAQAWSLAWDGRPLFDDPIEAWVNGPVSPRVYAKQKYEECAFNGNVSALDAAGLATIEAVVRGYGEKAGSWLSELAHREKPWLEARRGLPLTAQGNAVISQQAMRDWYGQSPERKKNFSAAFLRGLDVLVETPLDEVALLYGEPAPADDYVAWLAKGDDVWPDDP